MSHDRQGRVADQIRAELARLLAEEVRDPRIGFVTVTAVELSPDMRHARVFVSALGDDLEQTLRALRRATPFLKRGLARRSGLRFTPELRFLHDSSISTGFRVEELLHDLRPGEEEPTASEGEAGDSGGDEDDG